MSLRTVLVSDVFAYAFLQRRPYPSWEPFWIGILAGAIFFALAPLLMTGVLVISSDRDLMGEQTSGWLSKAMIGLAIALSLALTYRSLTDLAIRLFAHRAS